MTPDFSDYKPNSLCWMHFHKSAVCPTTYSRHKGTEVIQLYLLCNLIFYLQSQIHNFPTAFIFTFYLFFFFESFYKCSHCQKHCCSSNQNCKWQVFKNNTCNWNIIKSVCKVCAIISFSNKICCTRFC